MVTKTDIQGYHYNDWSGVVDAQFSIARVRYREEDGAPSSEAGEHMYFEQDFAFYLSVAPYQSNTTPFLKVPICDMDTSIFVPGTRYFGGFRPAPTPPAEGNMVSNWVPRYV